MTRLSPKCDSKASMVDIRTGSAPERAAFSVDRSNSEVSRTWRMQLRYPKSGETVKVARTFVIVSSHGRGFLRSGGSSQIGVAVTGGANARQAGGDDGAEQADGGHGHRLRVAEDGRRRLHRERRIGRNGDGPEPHGAEERVEELGARRIDEGDLVARPHAAGGEAGRVARALRPEPPVGHRVVEQREVLRVR